MLSRVADSLFWLSRYVERSDGILRMLRVNYAFSQDEVKEFSWNSVLRIFTYLEENQQEVPVNNTRKILQYMVLEKENPNSVLNIITSARENARSVQDHITIEMWQCLNDFFLTIKDPHQYYSLQREDPVSVLDVLVKKGMLYYGTTDVTMSRGEGNTFINLGKYLERALQSADILDVRFHDLRVDPDRPSDPTYWRYLLLSLSGHQQYLKTYTGGFQARNVVDQVVLNMTFPRSIRYSVTQLNRYFERLKSTSRLASFEEVSFLIGRLNSRLQFTNVDTIAQQNLHHFLREIKEELGQISNSLNQHYFAYA